MPRAKKSADPPQKSPTAIAQLLSDNLKKLMEASEHLTAQGDVGTAAKTDQTTIGRILNMTISPTLDKVDAIARAFGLEAWQLLTPGLHPTNPPLLVQQSAEVLKLLETISNSAEAAGGHLRSGGNTRPGDL